MTARIPAAIATPLYRMSPSLMNLWLPALIALLPGFLVAAIWKKLKK